MPKIVFEGTVFSGEGNGKKFVELPWVKRQIEEKLGFSPYSGNLKPAFNRKRTLRRKFCLKTAGGLVVEPQAGYCPGVLFKASIGCVGVCGCDSHKCPITQATF